MVYNSGGESMDLFNKVKEYVFGKPDMPPKKLYAFTIKDKYSTSLLDISDMAEKMWEEYAKDIPLDPSYGAVTLHNMEARRGELIYHFEVVER